jgi:DNA-binding MarR family transcriptional regulator
MMDVGTSMPSRAGKTYDSLGAVQLPCACASIRRAARAVTQFYDDGLRPSGLRATQFTLLQALHLAPGISQKQLAELLASDSTTLTRTLAHLRRKGWVRSDPAKDRREISLRLTAAGQREYERVLPYWQSTQRKFRRAWGQKRFDQVMSLHAEAPTAGRMS